MLYPKHPDAYPVGVSTGNRHPSTAKTPIIGCGICILRRLRKGELALSVPVAIFTYAGLFAIKPYGRNYKTIPSNKPDSYARHASTAMLQHPNTIPTYELGRDSKGHYYFTMKLVHGVTLREVLDKCKAKQTHNIGKFDLFRLVDVLSQVAHCLHYAHTHGVVHRDIKPENVLVGDFDEVMVLDWGMAKVWDDDARVNVLPEDLDPHWKLQKIDVSDEAIPLTRRAPVQGTPPYMSPEQLENPHDVDHRTDIYSLGTLIFEVLTLLRMN